MSIIPKFFTIPKDTEVPHFGFCLFILIPIVLGFAYAFYYLFPNHTKWYSFINIIITTFFVQFIRKWVIVFIEKRHNEHNANKWFIANIVFAIATIYMIAFGIIMFN